MYPELLTEHLAFSVNGKIHFPIPYGLSKSPLAQKCVRVILRGGHFYDLPASTLVKTRPNDNPVPIALQTPGDPLPAPCSFRRQLTTDLRYDYLASDNKGVSHRYRGVYHVTEAAAELAGWLLGDGSMHAERQSVRFANSDAGALQRVSRLAAKAFPSVRVGWYAKLSGYDLTFTAGINNPLKHFLRMLNFYEGCPLAVGQQFNGDILRAFLRGLWGADGWLYVRKGGNDVMFGLSRTGNEFLFSWLRLLHASLGLQGAREVDKHGHSRLVFNGYINYAVFMREIGQIRNLQMPVAPVRRPRTQQATFIANRSEVWYDAPVLKVLNLPGAYHTYRLKPQCLTPSTKPILESALNT